MTRILVIGASAGGVDALLRIAERLPPLPAAVLVAVHIGTQPSRLPSLLEARGRMPAGHAVDGEPLQEGRITVAPPDHHLMVMGERLRVVRGPKENHARPAIDPLFRSAALAYGRDVIGVVLSGQLDDGTAGLQAIKAMGGLAVVQDPADAACPAMPSSALRHVAVDHCVPADRMADLLAGLVGDPAPAWRAPLEDPAPTLEAEQHLLVGGGNAIDHLRRLGQPTTYTCTECHGALWAVAGSRPLRLRCHTGHAFTLDSLRSAVATRLDGELWNALRALQENALVLDELASAEETPASRATELHALARRVHGEVQALRNLIEASQAVGAGEATPLTDDALAQDRAGSC